MSLEKLAIEKTLSSPDLQRGYKLGVDARYQLLAPVIRYMTDRLDIQYMDEMKPTAVHSRSRTGR